MQIEEYTSFADQLGEGKERKRERNKEECENMREKGMLGEGGGERKERKKEKEGGERKSLIIPIYNTVTFIQ